VAVIGQSLDQTCEEVNAVRGDGSGEQSTPDLVSQAAAQELRSEIAATRADLGDTVEALAAKTDVKARARHAVGDAADQAKQKVAAASDRAARAAGALTETAATAKDQLPPRMRRPLPWAVLGAAALLAGMVVVLVRRRLGSAARR
jgi:hypothetical protein